MIEVTVDQLIYLIDKTNLRHVTLYGHDANYSVGLVTLDHSSHFAGRAGSLRVALTDSSRVDPTSKEKGNVLIREASKRAKLELDSAISGLENGRAIFFR